MYVELYAVDDDICMVLATHVPALNLETEQCFDAAFLQPAQSP